MFLFVPQAFRRGDVRLLVCTTVVEVGVDVPEATVVVVEHAERFGLAQLHQLRGRVGRGGGGRGGSCYLCIPFGDVGTARRLGVMERTNDGFAVAEWDLAQRGMGWVQGVWIKGQAWVSGACGLRGSGGREGEGDGGVGPGAGGMVWVQGVGCSGACGLWCAC